jgi:hypothetical protein
LRFCKAKDQNVAGHPSQSKKTQKVLKTQRFQTFPMFPLPVNSDHDVRANDRTALALESLHAPALAFGGRYSTILFRQEMS